MLRFLLPHLLLIGCSSNPAQPTTSTPADTSNPLLDWTARVTVTRIIDGDTWEFLERGEKIGVQVLGIDAFESRHGDRLREQADAAGISEDSAYTIGQRAKAFADSVLTGKTVTIARDYSEPWIDTYNRLLRHVSVDGSDCATMMRARGLVAP